MATLRQKEAYAEVCNALGDEIIQDALASLRNASFDTSVWKLLAFEHGYTDVRTWRMLLGELAYEKNTHTLLVQLYWRACVRDKYADMAHIKRMSRQCADVLDGAQIELNTSLNLDFEAMVKRFFRKEHDALLTEDHFQTVSMRYTTETLCYLLRHDYICKIGKKARKVMQPLFDTVTQRMMVDVKSEIVKQVLETVENDDASASG